MFKKILSLFIITACIISCRTRKDFIITDEYVNKELGIENASGTAAKPALSNEDKKYFAKKLDVDETEITNTKLYSFIKKWEGTKYAAGGRSQKGIDDSGLIEQLYNDVYNRKLRGPAADMAMDKRLFLFKSADNMREGDLVFFRLNNDEVITHVGIYLKNKKFFSTSKSGGAKIINFKNNPWSKGFVTAGRFQE